MKQVHNNKFQAMREGGQLLARVRRQLVEATHVGTKLSEIDELAMRLLKETGGEPAFPKVPNYKWATCINVNQGVVHGIPNNYEIEEGDLISIDVGLFYKGFYTDTSTSLIVGKAKEEHWPKFLEIGRRALNRAIKEAKLGKRVGHISKSIDTVLRKEGLIAIESLTGHGVGNKLHEPPYVPGILRGRIEDTQKLFEGQTLAIEVIYTTGCGEIKTEADNWTISTKDDKISGLFEETVAITSDGPVILTKE